MKEMFDKNTTILGDARMKKSLLIVVLALALMLALGATPAFAKYAGYSSSKQYVPWAEAQNLASANPDAALMAFGPHAGYATTTVKCAVCHSVHRGGTNLLLKAGDGTCRYCHTSIECGGGGVSATTISWTGLGPHNSRCSNTDCHGGPHGAGASSYAGPASKLLTAQLDTELNTLATANGVSTATFATYSATTRALATGALCGRDGCHANSLFGVTTAGATRMVTITNPRDTAVTGHRVIAGATSDWNTATNPAGAVFGTTKTGTIAYAPTEYCSSCHDLADDCNAGKAAFPHSITGVVDASVGADGTWRPAVWLTAGAFAGDTDQAAVGNYNQFTVTSRVYTNGNATQNAISSAAGSSILDGTCLKCHRGAGGTSGVGKTF
jgi:hypothetical protein